MTKHQEAENMNRKRIVQIIASLGSGLAALSMLINLVVATSRIDIQGPPGSQAFGKSITALPNGNLVVCDPGYDAAGIADVGRCTCTMALAARGSAL